MGDWRISREATIRLYEAGALPLNLVAIYARVHGKSESDILARDNFLSNVWLETASESVLRPSPVDSGRVL